MQKELQTFSISKLETQKWIWEIHLSFECEKQELQIYRAIHITSTLHSQNFILLFLFHIEALQKTWMNLNIKMPNQKQIHFQNVWSLRVYLWLSIFLFKFIWVSVMLLYWKRNCKCKHNLNWQRKAHILRPNLAMYMYKNKNHEE